jgi:hypothetical protein
MKEIRNASEILVRKPRHRWEDNIKMYLEVIVCEGVYWIHVASRYIEIHSGQNMLTYQCCYTYHFDLIFI